jgi:lipopolysaccharide transport system ATP-binding protein
MDIRQPIGVEMEFDVLEAGRVLVPNFHFYNEEGICLFIVNDNNPEWHQKPRLAGRYTTTTWIPGNFLAEGSILVGAALSTHDPLIIHFYERDAVAFHVVDSLTGNSARGDYAGHMPGVIRPLLNWTSEFVPSDRIVSQT